MKGYIFLFGRLARVLRRSQLENVIGNFPDLGSMGSENCPSRNRCKVQSKELHFEGTNPLESDALKLAERAASPEENFSALRQSGAKK